jgi:hypothetical protein
LLYLCINCPMWDHDWINKVLLYYYFKSKGALDMTTKSHRHHTLLIMSCKVRVNDQR